MSGQDVQQDAGRVLVLRRATLAMLVVLLCQYGIGIGVNLYVETPSGKPTNGAGPGFARALTQGAPVLVVHVAVGFCLIAGAVAIVRLAAATRRRIALTAGIAGLVTLLAALFSGATFVASGNDSASLAMALFTAVAMLSYVVVLFVSHRTPEA